MDNFHTLGVKNTIARKLCLLQGCGNYEEIRRENIGIIQDF